MNYATKASILALVAFLADSLPARAPVASVAVQEQAMRLLVLPVRFSDSPAPPVTREALQREYFDGPSESGTLTEYFLEASGGRFRLTGEVADWVQTSRPRASWDESGTEFLNGRMEQAAAAIRAADAVIDFRLYDNDGPDGVPDSGDDDGVVDAGVALIWAEPSAPCSGHLLVPQALRFASPDRIGTPIVTNDTSRATGQPITIARASFSSAVECNGTRVAGLATLAHELGHQIFDLPDVYAQDPVLLPVGGFDRLNGRRWILGCWEIMSAGSSWGCGSGPGGFNRRPTLFAPNSRELIGWLTPTVLGEVRDQTFVLRPAAEDGNVLRFYMTPGSQREYFQLEYRQQMGFDAGLPASGVMVYSLDADNDIGSLCRFATDCSRRFEEIVEADGRNDLRRNGLNGGNRGEASDVFGTGAGPRRFGGNTIPAPRRRDGSITTLTVHDIQVDEVARVAHIRLSTARMPALVRNDGAELLRAALEEVNLVSRAAGGALPYTWRTEQLPAGVSLSVFPGTDSVALVGTVLDAGTFAPSLIVTDALGSEVRTDLDWVIAAVSIPAAALWQGVLEGSLSSALSAAQRLYLDQLGNRNGRFDLGDVRAEWLRQRPGGAAPH